MFGDREAVFFGDLPLAALDGCIVKFLNAAAARADYVVVVVAVGYFEHRPVPLELQSPHQPGLFALGEHPVNGGDTGLFTTFYKKPVDILRAEVSARALLQDVEDLYPRYGHLQARLLQRVRNFRHIHSFQLSHYLSVYHQDGFTGGAVPRCLSGLPVNRWYDSTLLPKGIRNTMKETEKLKLGEGLPLSQVLDRLPYNADGLIPAIAQQYDSGEVLMMAWMNRQALEETLQTGRVCYWSRSRQKFWRKGESSGQVQVLKDTRFDCDGDTILLLVDQTGPACHTGRRSCFYNAVRGDRVEVVSDPLIDPRELYGK